MKGTDSEGLTNHTGSDLEINCINVAKGYSAIPPQKARDYIDDSLALIAVITRRDKLSDTEYLMPASVREEIAMAYHAHKDLLLITEDGVRLDGFTPNFGTHLPFTKETIRDVDFIEKLTGSLYGLRMKLSRVHNPSIGPEFYEFYSESSLSLAELRVAGEGDFFWTLSVTKRLRFTQPYRRPIKIACWSSQIVVVPEDAKAIEMRVEVEQGSKEFQIETTIEKASPTAIEGLLRVIPEPTEDDYIVYTTRYKSKYINPVYAEDIKTPSILTIRDKKFHCFDGLIAIQPTKRLKAQYRFPREYGLTKEDFQFFVGSYTTTVDHIVESEMNRAEPTVDSFGGELVFFVFDVEVESPWLRHMYGFAWNPPHKKTPVPR